MSRPAGAFIIKCKISRLKFMKKLIAVFLFFIHLSVKTQINDFGFYYSVIPFKMTVLLANSNFVGLKINLASKSKFSAEAFTFYGTNNYQSTYNSQTRFNAQITADIFDDQEVTTSFSGSQFGFGLGIYYQLLKKDRFTISPGLNASLSFYCKAGSRYGKIYHDSLDGYYRFKGDFYSNNNYLNLRDNSPDIFLVNFQIKFQYLITDKISFYTEPFVSLFGRYKTYNALFRNAGLNVGITWKIKKTSVKK